MKNHSTPLRNWDCVESNPGYQLFLGLKKNDNRAVQQLTMKTTPAVRSLAMARGISHEDFEEILHDAILTCLRKIQDGTCRYMNCNPATYTVAVARRLMANHCRKRAFDCISFEEYHGTTETDRHEFLLKKEAEQLLHETLSKLGKCGANLIRLHYLEGYRDEEVVRLKLTPYTTVNSLKTKRCWYLRKLAAMIESEWG